MPDMQARRLDDVKRGSLPPEYQRGDIWRMVDDDGALIAWYCVAPTELHCAPGSLMRHQVVEEADGTITVTPSILIHFGDGAEYHGFLTHGNWHEV